VKEREAVQTIMEHKIKALVDSVALATAGLQGEGGGTGSPTGA
jgi:hypothetical protein